MPMEPSPVVTRAGVSLAAPVGMFINRTACRPDRCEGGELFPSRTLSYESMTTLRPVRLCPHSRAETSNYARLVQPLQFGWLDTQQRREHFVRAQIRERHGRGRANAR